VAWRVLRVQISSRDSLFLEGSEHIELRWFAVAGKVCVLSSRFIEVLYIWREVIDLSTKYP